MFDRNKSKIKIQINKALNNINNIVKTTSEVKQMLQQSSKDIVFEKNDKVHETLIDQTEGKEFILCEQAKDQKTDNYRSPYSNQYFPQHKEDMYMLSPPLRDLEEKGNLLFSEYAKLYYGEDGCIANFYVFETEEGLNFNFLLKKIYKDPECFGVWSSANLVEIRGDPSKSVSYKIQTSVIYEFNILNDASQELTEVFGSLKKNRVQPKRWSSQYELDQFHLQMAGRLIEQIETSLRQQMQNIFFKKTQQIVFKTRYIHGKQEDNQRKAKGKQLAKMRNQSGAIADPIKIYEW